MLALIVAVAGFIASQRTARGPAESATSPAPAAGVRSAVPRGAILVASVDIAALRQHPLTGAIWREGRQLDGLGEVVELCGSDPLAGVEELAVAIPAQIDAGFGVFATGPLEAEPLIRCAATIVERRGGSPSRGQRDGFTVLRDASLTSSSAELAVRERGPLVLAEPSYLAPALRAALGEVPSVASDAAHEELLAAAGDGVVVATAVLTREQRAALADELARQGLGESPFAAVRSAALALRLDNQLRLHAVLGCDRAAACARAAELIEQALGEEEKSPLAEVLGLSALLRRVHVEAREGRVHVRAALPVEDVLALVQRIVALRRVNLAEEPTDGP